jgi:hypothetical protein
MGKESSYMKKLLTNGSGTSVKSFLAFIVAIVGILLLISITAVIWVDVLYNKELKTTLEFYPEVIASVSALIFAGALPKIVGEVTEKFKKKEDE